MPVMVWQLKNSRMKYKISFQGLTFFHTRCKIDPRQFQYLLSELMVSKLHRIYRKILHWVLMDSHIGCNGSFLTLLSWNF